MIVALRALGDIAPVAAAVVDGRLEALLRSSPAHHGATSGRPKDHDAPDPATAVLAACAHLAAGAREGAYLALRTARDFLPREATPGPAKGAASDTVLEKLRQPAATTRPRSRPRPAPESRRPRAG